MQEQRGEHGRVVDISDAMRRVATPCTSYAELAERSFRLEHQMAAARLGLDAARRRAAAADVALAEERHVTVTPRG